MERLFEQKLRLTEKGVEERIRFGHDVVEAFLPFFEGASLAHPAFRSVLADNYKAGIAGVLFANALERVHEVVGLPVSEIGKLILEGESVLSYRRKKLFEASTTADVGAWDAQYLGISAFLFPSLLATNIVSVQPLTAPTGVIFYKIYETDGAHKGIPSGSVLNVDTISKMPASDIVSTSIGTGNGVNTNFSGTLSPLPVIPKSVIVQAGSVMLFDDGNGNIVGEGGSGTVNYTNGNIAVSFTSPVPNGVAVVVQYRYAQEANVFAKAKLKLVRDTVSVQSRKLGFEWTTELAQDLYAYHQIAIEDEVADTLIREVASEIDAYIINEMRRIAIQSGPATVFWSKTPPLNVAYVDHKTTLMSEIKKLFAKIVEGIGAVPPGSTMVLLCGMEAWGILQDMANFTREPNKVMLSDALSGVIDGSINVYATPFLPSNEIIVRLYNPDPTFTDYIYAPYRVEVSPPVNRVLNTGAGVSVDPFSWVKGILSRDAFKQVRNGFNARIVITS
jgi:hypothetical protein